MRILKSNPVLTILNSYLVDSPQPSTISYLWNFGSLLGLSLVAQIVTGILLAMHYAGTAELAFNSVEHIMRDVNEGWMVRYTHANMASFFFIAVYLHISRGLYYGSYRSPRIGAWVIGTIIFFLMMATAFLGYVLPYGQMSLWGATVITNLLSAIPWLGKSLVESIKAKELFWLLIIYFIINIYLEKRIKLNIFDYIFNYWNNLFLLDTIGIVSPHAHKKGRNVLDKNELLIIPYSFLAMLTGLIDGDGYISATKTSKGYIRINLIISLNIRDLPLLEYIKSILKIGNINTYPKIKEKNTCKLVINSTDLKEIFFPLLIYHKLYFLTDIRRKQYDKAIFLFKKNIKLYSEIPINIPLMTEKLNNPNDYINLPFFNNWIVGFTIAEGSFLIKSNNDGCFQLRQRMDLFLFQSFNIKFQTNKKIGLGKGKYNLFSLNSKSDIQKVINFFSYSGHHPLLGYQLIRYQNWLLSLRTSKRYGGLIYPIDK
jgi:hypothetical protein